MVCGDSGVSSTRYVRQRRSVAACRAVALSPPQNVTYARQSRVYLATGDAARRPARSYGVGNRSPSSSAGRRRIRGTWSDGFSIVLLYLIAT